MTSLRVGLLGGIPPALGGGGLELQMERTAAALSRAGHRPVMIGSAARETPLDVLHVFGTEPAAWHYLRHWTRNRVPLVVTSIVVVSPGLEERLMRMSARIPGAITSGRMRSDVLRRADAVIAGTVYEARLVRRLGAPEARVDVVGNGADCIDRGALPDGLPPRYVLMVGAISPRKRQAEVAAALAGGPAPLVVAGAYAGPEGSRADVDRLLADSGAIALGQVDDPRTIAALQHGAEAVVHLSEAEVQSLAVLEALAQGTPVLGSDIPSHRELAAAYPGWVELVGAPEHLPAALARRSAAPPPAKSPSIPTWDEVAEKLVSVYGRVVS